LPGLSWHFWFLSTWCLYHWERDCGAAQELDFKMYGFFHFLYKRKQLTVTIIKRKWRLYQATEVVPSCITRGTCIPNMLPDYDNSNQVASFYKLPLSI
jgi:hypothetical protein